MKRELREKVWEKYGRRCAYCGKELTYKQLQVDHIDPVYRTWKNHPKGDDSFENLNPSCARCNNWKHAMPLDTFKSEVGKQVERLKRDRSQFRLALDYGLVVETGADVVFYFERVESQIPDMGPKTFRCPCIIKKVE